MRTVKLFICCMMVMLTHNVFGQQMTDKLVKKAHVVVMLDQYYSYNSGNIIILRLDDKSRNDNWHQSVLVRERCNSTNVETKSAIPLGKVFYASFYTQESGDFTSISTSNYNEKMDRLCIDYSNSTNGKLIVELDDKYGYRKYGVTTVLFYKTVADYYTGKGVGETTDMAKAGQYLAKMFEVYK